MIHQLTNNARRACIYISISLFLASSNAFAMCKLEKTPLINEEACEEFQKSDRALNTSYRTLIVRLEKESKETLRSIQREWIKWRDGKCHQVQEESGCNRNGSCNGVAHDMCIVDLTDQRTNELREFIANINAAKEKNFTYSRNYD